MADFPPKLRLPSEAAVCGLQLGQEQRHSVWIRQSLAHAVYCRERTPAPSLLRFVFPAGAGIQTPALHQPRTGNRNLTQSPGPPLGQGRRGIPEGLAQAGRSSVGSTRRSGSQRSTPGRYQLQQVYGGESAEIVGTRASGKQVVRVAFPKFERPKPLNGYKARARRRELKLVCKLVSNKPPRQTVHVFF